MLIARAPVRISFLGGGTDLPAYYERFGGAVLSTTIDKHFYVVLEDSDGPAQVSSSDYRTYFRLSRDRAPVWDDDMRLPRAVMDYFAVDRGLSVFLASEIPPGTGLGSSGAVTVALVKAMAAREGRILAPAEVAELACHIDIVRLDQPIGKQDQYASAFGGLNVIEFSRDAVTVTPLELSLDALLALERRVLLFFTGASRRSTGILAGQKQRITEDRDETLQALHQMKAQVYRGRALLEAGRLDDFGLLLGAAWEAKKRVAAGVTNHDIDRYYDLARAAGALGGKIVGAGGGGFLMVYASEGSQNDIIARLEREGLYWMDSRFESQGAKVLVNALVTA